MPLPKIDVPSYALKLPSNNKEINYRPFLIKEEKILLIANEGAKGLDDETAITGEMKSAIIQILRNCILNDDIVVEDMAIIDVEYLMINLRAKSISNTVKTYYRHAECKKITEIIIDLNTIEVKKNKDNNPKVELTNNVGIMMKYPNINIMDAVTNLEEDNIDNILNIICKCIESIYDETDVYTPNDYTEEELLEFILGLTQHQFEKIKTFLDTVPKIQKEIKFSCIECGHEERIMVKGLSNFFG